MVLRRRLWDIRVLLYRELYERLPVGKSRSERTRSANERQKPPRSSARILDKMQLSLSTGRHVDGIWVGSWRTPEDLTRVEHALHLVKRHSPLHYSRIIRDLERIWIFLVPEGLGHYDHSLKACVLDERFIADAAISVERIASTIVHESTHARLERFGIAYEEELRGRIEAICFRRELALAVRLPDGAKLVEEIARYLEWYGANSDYFREAHWLERLQQGEIEMLRNVGVPELLIRATLTLKSIVGGIRRLLRILRPC
jgi:hypothetical protein